MKKIMFNDRYGLTEAVLSGRKTMTRRLADPKKYAELRLWQPYLMLEYGVYGYTENDGWVYIKPQYHLGEVVAVAQSYKDAGVNPDYIVSYNDDGTPVSAIQSPGWKNKMFTRADLMPHHIRITGIRIERLQEITNEGCFFEGILQPVFSPNFQIIDHEKSIDLNFNAPREAFAALIDKVSGRGTWESNPYVVVYQFELVK